MNTDHFDKSREVFETYGSFLDDGPIPGNKMSSIQVRLNRWAKVLDSVMGVANLLGQCEEVGELIESVMGKLDDPEGFSAERAEKWHMQVQMGSADAVEDPMDAIADILVFTTQLCSRIKLDFGTLFEAGLNLERQLVATKKQKEPANNPDLIGYAMLGAAACVGRIHHATLKNKQKIRGYDNETKYFSEVATSIVHLSRFCQCFCLALDRNIYQVYFMVVEKVMKRTWATNKTDGGEAKPEQG